MIKIRRKRRARLLAQYPKVSRGSKVDREQNGLGMWNEIAGRGVEERKEKISPKHRRGPSSPRVWRQCGISVFLESRIFSVVSFQESREMSREKKKNVVWAGGKLFGRAAREFLRFCVSLGM